MKISRAGTIPRISVTTSQAAISTGFSRGRIARAIRAGDLEARQHGKARVIEVDELQRWVASLPAARQIPARFDL
jgi:Helix-turn-helix domain